MKSSAYAALAFPFSKSVQYPDVWLSIRRAAFFALVMLSTAIIALAIMFAALALLFQFAAPPD
jgi:hypothetical protein